MRNSEKLRMNFLRAANSQSAASLSGQPLSGGSLSQWTASLRGQPLSGGSLSQWTASLRGQSLSGGSLSQGAASLRGQPLSGGSLMTGVPRQPAGTCSSLSSRSCSGWQRYRPDESQQQRAPVAPTNTVVSPVWRHCSAIRYVLLVFKIWSRAKMTRECHVPFRTLAGSYFRLRTGLCGN